MNLPHYTPCILKETKLGRKVPPGWQTGKMDETTWVYCDDSNNMAVLESVSSRRTYSDGKRWHHISVSFPDHLPTWPDLEMVKRVFMGHEVTVLQIIPPVYKYVNHMKYCLHLWRCLDGDVTPDFSNVLDGVRHV